MLAAAFYLIISVSSNQAIAAETLTSPNLSCTCTNDNARPQCATDDENFEACEFIVDKASPYHLRRRAIAFIFDIPVGSLSSQGYLEIENDNTIIFKIKNPNDHQRLKKYLIENNISQDFSLFTPLKIDATFYLFSHTLARSKGIDMSIVKDGTVGEMAKIAGGAAGLAFNFGNLITDVLSLTFNWMSNHYILFRTERQSYGVLSGGLLDSESSTKLYRDGPTDTAEEYGEKAITGRVTIDSRDSNKIIIENFGVKFYLPAQQGKTAEGTPPASPTALIENFSRPNLSDRQIELNKPWIVYSSDVETSSYYGDKALLSFSNGTERETFKFLIVLKASLENEEQPRDLNGNKVYKLSEEERSKLPVGDASSVPALLDENLLQYTVVPSGFGPNSMMTAFYINAKDKLTQTAAKTNVLVTMAGKGFKHTFDLQLENLVVGPLYVPEFDPVFFTKNKNGIVPFKMTIQDHPAYKKINRGLGLKGFKIEHEFILNPANKTLQKVSGARVKGG